MVRSFWLVVPAMVVVPVQVAETACCRGVRRVGEQVDKQRKVT